jgi:hypothetical protein
VNPSPRHQQGLESERFALSLRFATGCRCAFSASNRSPVPAAPTTCLVHVASRPLGLGHSAMGRGGRFLCLPTQRRQKNRPLGLTWVGLFSQEALGLPRAGMTPQGQRGALGVCGQSPVLPRLRPMNVRRRVTEHSGNASISAGREVLAFAPQTFRVSGTRKGSRILQKLLHSQEEI